MRAIELVVVEVLPILRYMILLVTKWLAFIYKQLHGEGLEAPARVGLFELCFPSGSSLILC